MYYGAIFNYARAHIGYAYVYVCADGAGGGGRWGISKCVHRALRPCCSVCVCEGL